MPQIAAATATVGDVYYILTGTNNFEYILNDMVDGGLIINDGTTDEKTPLLQEYDGYRLKFYMLNNPSPNLTATDDVNAVCFFSETEAEGAICAGAKYNGSAMEAWAYWVEKSAFSAVVQNSLEITGVDKSSDYWLLDPSGDNDVSVGVDWSIFRFQPVGTGGSYSDDFRFSPSTTDI